MSARNVLVYMIRRDSRVSDNPILHHLATSQDHGFTHLLPVYVIHPTQYEVSGFVKEGSTSPFPEARSGIGRFWRCGPHRAKFVAESIWDMKESLEKLGSGLVLRVGKPGAVLKGLLDGLRDKDYKVGAVWTVSLEGYEEKNDQQDMAAVCSDAGSDFQVWVDEKYFIDE